MLCPIIDNLTHRQSYTYPIQTLHCGNMVYHGNMLLCHHTSVLLHDITCESVTALLCCLQASCGSGVNKLEEIS